MRNIWPLLWIVFVAALNFSYSQDVLTVENNTDNQISKPTFIIDYDNNRFLINGSPFRYVAGSIHYFRTPHQYWRDRLRALRAAGLNAVTTYVEWSFHEPEKGQYKWTGDQDLIEYIEIAKEEDLYVILRPGPYICAERDMGGFPYWLLHYYPNIRLRTSDEVYKAEVTKWYSELMTRIQPYLFGRGGPIIMVQVENEYGSFSACDYSYMSWLANLTRTWVQQDAVLFTTDGTSDKMLACGSTPDAYSTVDFGTSQNIEKSWESMRKYAGNGPLINSEFYPGWLTHWGEPIARVSTKSVVNHLESMLEANASVNFYMFHGGTNFDYTAGSNLGNNYTPDLTSYDYDAPLTEAGDPTKKYFSIRESVLKYLPVPNVLPPSVKDKWSSETFVVEPVLHLLSTEGRARMGRPSTVWEYPPTMEAVRQRSGLILYETIMNSPRSDPSALTVYGLKDRALVYISDMYVGVLSRTKKLYTLPVLADQGNYVQILVENQGRINYGAVINDFKGITRNITLNNANLKHWTVTSFPLETIEDDLTKSIGDVNKIREKVFTTKKGLLKEGPVVYKVSFEIDGSEEPLDSYLDMSGWGKGYVWVNDRHLGRYWPKEGPQVTLFTPGVYFKKYPDINTLIILELQAAPESLSVKFVNKSIGV